MSDKKDYPNSGAFFVNNKKRPDKKDPDYNGNGEITCPHCNKKHEGWLNIWSKTGGKGDFWSWAWKPKESSGSSQGSSLGGKSLSSGSQQDMGYSSSMSPRDQERAQSQKRDFGGDIDDTIPF